jgi:hypothetical protein
LISYLNNSSKNPYQDEENNDILSINNLSTSDDTFYSSNNEYSDNSEL